eukprot:3506-Heterococcus_DN1.PRE.8
MALHDEHAVSSSYNDTVHFARKALLCGISTCHIDLVLSRNNNLSDPVHHSMHLCALLKRTKLHLADTCGVCPTAAGRLILYTSTTMHTLFSHSMFFVIRQQAI